MLLVLTILLAACGGDKGADTAAQTNNKTTTINTPIKVDNANGNVDTPPPAVVQRSSLAGAAVGTITNPIMKGAVPTQPPPMRQAPPGNVVQQQQPRAPEPPQNAKGVWHYICSTGCAGGAGSAMPCKSCGKTLAHNQAYHQ